MSLSMDYDAIIIGAGMSGLAAGIRLAYYDSNVCIVERHHRVGGLNSFYSRDGHKFDVGLHAMTNYVPRGVKSTPLPRLLRQLRLRPEDFDLCQQNVSWIKFPEKSLRFTNDPDFFIQEVAENFPAQADNFQKLLKTVTEYDDLALDAKPISAHEIVDSIITDPLLIDRIFCPLMYYGSAQEDDMEFGWFCTMFKGIFLEGFARPQAGARLVLDTLVRKYKEHGGELRLGRGVRSINVANGSADSVVLDNGEELKAQKILSSAGYLETMQLLSDYGLQNHQCDAGQITLVEAILVLDKEPAEMGYDTTITFFNNADEFHFRKPEGPYNLPAGVVCCPNNFQFDTPLPEGVIRITNMANYDLWNGLSEEEYKAQKAAWLEAVLDEVAGIVPWLRESIVYSDVFTPRTIHSFTSHLNGAVYGTPNKTKMGTTHLDNLFICGTDQGFLGIIGAMLSGISMANFHLLQRG